VSGDIFDVCVIGGGPAGAVAAWKLARLGHTVLVIERAAFPRPHIGEALSPGVWPQLDLLGLTEVICAAGFRPTRTAIVRWSGPPETVEHGDPPGLMVDRGRFDRLLLDHARKAGAQVLQPVLALQPRRTDDGWIVPVRSPESPEGAIRARFLIDASGRSARLGGRRQRTGPRRLALSGAWKRHGGWGEETRTEAGTDGWLWAAARPDGAMSAMVFLDAERYRAERAAGISRAALYRDLLARSHLLADTVRAELSGEVEICDATCRHAMEPVGDSFLKVGEAAYALDPLSSTGVQKAMQTAWTGAIAVHTILTKPENAAMARRFYADSHHATVARHTAWAAQLYAEVNLPGIGFLSPLSRRGAGRETGEGPGVRAPFGATLRLSPAAALVETPCITGDRIEMRRALIHPSLERPVAFLDGVEIAPLLDGLATGLIGAAALDGLMAAWLVRQGILVMS